MKITNQQIIEIIKLLPRDDLAISSCTQSAMPNGSMWDITIGINLFDDNNRICDILNGEYNMITQKDLNPIIKSIEKLTQEVADIKQELPIGATEKAGILGAKSGVMLRDTFVAFTKFMEDTKEYMKKVDNLESVCVRKDTIKVIEPLYLSGVVKLSPPDIDDDIKIEDEENTIYIASDEIPRLIEWLQQNLEANNAN